jgi:hypothetical protein
MTIATLGLLLGTTLSLADPASPPATQSPTTAGSAAPPLVSLHLDRCPMVPPDDVQSMIAVEIHRPVVPPAGDGAAITTVNVTCEGLRAEIRIDDPITGKTIGRVVDLATAAPVARPHLLALSIVELLAATWIELQSNPNPTSPPLGAPPTPEARAAALAVVSSRSGARRRPRLLAAVAVQTSTADLQSIGGGLLLGGNLGVRFGWMADVGFQHGDRQVALGRVSADSATTAGALVVGPTWDRIALRAGLGVRGGGAWLSGTPTDPAAVGGAIRGFWWGPIAVLDGSLTLRGRIVLELTLEAGHVMLPVVATVQGADSVAIDGTWIRGGLGVGITL